MKITLTRVGVEDKTFRSYSELLRWIAKNRQQAGQTRSPRTYYLPKPEDHGHYWLSRELWHDISTEDYARLYALQQRYKEYCHYREEIEPEWRSVNRINWMDNSVDDVQEDKYGRRRSVQLTGPHGDACY